VLLEGKAALPRYEVEVEQWLASPIEPKDREWFPLSSGAQGRAKLFFESISYETLSALGVVIIEGDCPGSPCNAAELRQPINKANAAAAAMELSFRFKNKQKPNGK
jgi:hypothetical protein